MSECNVELHRHWIEAFASRDIEAVIALCDPSVEFRSGFRAVGGGVYYGHDGMRRWHRDLEGACGEQIRVQPDAYFDLGEDALIFFVYHGRGEHSGAEVAMQATSVAQWRDGLLTHSTVYLDRAQALRDLGVTEDALEPIAP
jgi:ketosteroid isomerase-like protein